MKPVRSPPATRRRPRDRRPTVRFRGYGRDRGHQRWFEAFAEYYDVFYTEAQKRKAAAFLDRVFRRHGPVRTVLDVACGTFALDLGLVECGYQVTGVDLSAAMLRAARRTLRGAGMRSKLEVMDMRELDLGERYDAVLCLGTAFNYLVARADVDKTLRGFHRHLRPGGLLVLDLANFDSWIHNPQNARVEGERFTPDSTRVAVFGFGEQNRSKTIHTARMITVVQRRERIDLHVDEAPLRVWTKSGIAKALKRAGFHPIEWWGHLGPRSRYRRRASPRLIPVAVRR